MTQNIFYRTQAAQEHTALARSTFYAYIAQGLLPPPIKIGKRSSLGLSLKSLRSIKHEFLGSPMKK